MTRMLCSKKKAGKAEICFYNVLSHYKSEYVDIQVDIHIYG